MLQKNAVINCKTNEVEYVEVEVDEILHPTSEPYVPEPTLEEQLATLQQAVLEISMGGTL